MIQNDMPSSADDSTWWRAPLVATLLGLPLLGWEYALWGGNTFRVLGGAVCWAFVLLAVAWALPHRRSARMLRITAACAALVCAFLPLLLVVLLAMVMTTG
ncbi:MULTISPECIES: hypothetical protein [unclassified Streptomyces]|uniref:hypothetical protein n=1 Tax=unclassified Streptomyces TaxID=2593676 RepID=UPI0023650224|nr:MULTISPECIES: hypothetical protein [unclassified Streptomyces]MDF3145348.1 hypothetical protein [Streptomyces sp. T21Q-yed]WDF39680.1 hypothetical protein PBV52_24220 [Streptomyces sp. T12]